MTVYIEEKINDFDLQAALSEISEQRREQALQFKFEHGQRTCVLAYLLLKRALREQYGIDENPLFEYGEHGKPSIVGHPEIHFNVSHCREAVACAVSDHPVGIDVESIQRFNESLVRFTMNDEEVSQTLSAPQPGIVFTRYWTMKEAYLKLTGEGITNEIKEVLVNCSATFTTTECIPQGYIYTVCEY